MKNYITWNKYNEIINSIINFAKQQNIEKVIGIYKGGLIPGVQIANVLKIPLDIIIFQSYDGKSKKAEYINKTEPKNNVLLIDDIIDTGNTIRQCLDIINENVFVSSIITKKRGLEFLEQNNIKHYIPYLDKSDIWIVFPWEI